MRILLSNDLSKKGGSGREGRGGGKVGGEKGRGVGGGGSL